MRDMRRLLIALLLAVPFACHDDRGPKSPNRGTAGNGETGPATTPPTNEPVVPDVPNAADNHVMNEKPQRFDSRLAFDDSPHATSTSNTIGQPLPPGGGGTIGTGGTTGGIGPNAGTGAISTGGSIVH